MVFTTRHGTPIEPRNFNRSFERCIVAARVPRINVHGTRKTCASLLAAQDVHPRVAMRILGLHQNWRRPTPSARFGHFAPGLSHAIVSPEFNKRAGLGDMARRIVLVLVAVIAAVSLAAGRAAAAG